MSGPGNPAPPAGPGGEESGRPLASRPEIDLARVHGSILREPRDPAEGRAGVPLWFVTLIMALVFWSGFYLANNAGGFRADTFNPSQALAARKPADPATLGERVYRRNCVLCHQANGEGTGAYYPPLAGSEWVESRDGRADNHLVNILLHGMEGAVTVRGRVYNGAMPAWKFLRDEDIAAVLNYVRTTWGNAAPPIAPDFVKAMREQTKDRSGPWTQRELRERPPMMAPPPAPGARLGIPPKNAAAPSVPIVPGS